MAPTVLIADDALFMRSVLRDIVTTVGFTVLGEAGTGLEAVALYDRLRPDVMTMDVVMPDMTGIDAVKKIIEIDSNARILMCSSLGQQVMVKEAIQAGARDYILKPFQAGDVLTAIKKVLS